MVARKRILTADKLRAHVVVRGLHDPKIQEDVLKLAASSEVDLTLQKITEVTMAQDLELNKISQFQKQKRNAPGKSKNFVAGEKCYYCGECGHGYRASFVTRKELCPAFYNKCSKCNVERHLTSQCKRESIKAAAANNLKMEERFSKASSDSENELGAFGFIGTLTSKGCDSPSPVPSSDSDHYDGDSDRSSVSSDKNGENFEWFHMSMNIKSSSAKSSNKRKQSKVLPHYEVSRSGKGRGKSTKPHPEYEFAALQHVLHQPTSQQMTGTLRTEWKEIDTVADTLNKLSLLTSVHRNNSQEGGII